MGDRWTHLCCNGRRRKHRVAAYEASSAWARESEKETTKPMFPAHMAVRCSNMMVSGGISFNSGCDCLIEPPKACAVMKCYNCGNTIAAGRYPGLAELIRARDARKAEIIDLYEEHNPGKFKKVDALMEEWVGEEGVLLLKIRNHYMPPPVESSEDETPPTVWYESLTTGIIREGPEPDSAKAGKLTIGEVIEVVAERELEGGFGGSLILRVCCEKGWVSVTAKTGKAMMKRLPDEMSAKQRKYQTRIARERDPASSGYLDPDQMQIEDGEGEMEGALLLDDGEVAQQAESAAREEMSMEQYEAEMAADEDEGP
jgi:hypothetical protein